MSTMVSEGAESGQRYTSVPPPSDARYTEAGSVTESIGSESAVSSHAYIVTYIRSGSYKALRGSLVDLLRWYT